MGLFVTLLERDAQTGVTKTVDDFRGLAMVQYDPVSGWNMQRGQADKVKGVGGSRSQETCTDGKSLPFFVPHNALKLDPSGLLEKLGGFSSERLHRVGQAHQLKLVEELRERGGNSSGNR